MDPTLIELSEFFASEEKATDFLEKARWPNGVQCPRCEHPKVYRIKTTHEKNRRRKLWKCASCKKQFSVRIGTVFEDSRIPLNKWLAAFYLVCSAKKGVSSKHLERSLGVSYKTAWFMSHRVRHAMSRVGSNPYLKGIVEVDETYVGGKSWGTRGRGAKGKSPVVALVKRGGEARSFHVPNVSSRSLHSLIRREVDPASHIMTDQFRGYFGLGLRYKGHHTVRHRTEYVRDSDNLLIHTNEVESYFASLKRSFHGTFHQLSPEHLQRYLAEFDFRWNSRKLTDFERLFLLIKGAEGKRLTLRDLISPLSSL